MIKFDKVSKFYKTEDSVSVGMKKISLEFELNEFVAITGESGSGKSTLLNVISGLDGYEEGELYLFGEETSHYTIADWERYRGAYVGFVFQNYNIIDSYTVLQNVLLGLEIQGYPKAKRKQRALELIEQVGLSSHKHHKASKLSGGQKQRCVIARALAKDCPIIVADEPTGNLDSESSKQIIKLLNDIRKDKLVIIVTHDYEQVEQYVTRKIKMHDGEVVEDKKIQSHEKALETPELVLKQMPYSTIIKFGIRNLFATPKKLIFIILLQMLVAAVFILVYSNQIQSIRETGLSQSNAFPSTPETRVLVERRDGLPMTESELNNIKNNRYVDQKLVYQYATNFYNSTDIYLFRSDADYFSYIVAGTDTAKRLKSSDYTGSLPTLKNEIIISSYDGAFKVGDEVRLDINSYYVIDGNKPVNSTFKITGISKKNDNIIYFSEALLNQLPSEKVMFGTQAKESLYDLDNNDLMINIDGYSLRVIGVNPDLNGYTLRTIEEDPILLNANINMNYSTGRGFFSYHLRFEDVSIYLKEDYQYQEVQISEAFLDEIVDLVYDKYINNRNASSIESDNLVSVNVKNISSGNNFINSMDESIYRIYYPAIIETPMRDFMVFFQSLLAVILLSFFGMFLYSLIHAVSKNVMQSRQKDFAIYRSIGTNKSTLGKLVVTEQIIQSLFSFVLTFIILLVLQFYIPFIQNAIGYMQFQDYIILIFVFMAFGAWLGLRYNKKIFKYSVIESLTMSREE